MEYLSEDPRFLAGGLALLAGACLIALRLTQQGKYLVRAMAAFGLLLAVVGVERIWVTDNERIEKVVYAVAEAVADGDAAGALAQMDDGVRYSRGGTTLSPEATRAGILDLLESSRFDFLRITSLKANAGAQSRRGTADFRVICSGSIARGSYNYNFGSTNSVWSLGLREASPGVWKVNRITPVETPRGENVLPR